MASPIAASTVFTDKVNLTDSMDWIDALVVEEIQGIPLSLERGFIPTCQLKGTPLSCTIDTQAAQWKYRKDFIKKVLKTVFSEYPKKEPLVLISLGSQYLLIEYIIGMGLIAEGFDVTFFCVDPIYEDLRGEQLTENVISEFISRINKYKKQRGVFDAYSKIHFCSHASLLCNDEFPCPANVVLLESLPPTSEIIADMKRLNLKVKEPAKLLAGSYILPTPTNANAITFLPNSYQEKLKERGVKLKAFLPLAELTANDDSLPPFFIDWGCKIYSDGTFSIILSGMKNFLKLNSLTMNSSEQALFKTGIKKAIKTLLTKEIRISNYSTKQLPQNEVSRLLAKVHDVFVSFMPDCTGFFLTDYEMDCSKVKNFLSSKIRMGNTFLFEASGESYEVTIEGIARKR